MSSVERETITLSGRSIEFWRIRARSLHVKPLSGSAHTICSDYCNFIHLPHNEPHYVLACDDAAGVARLVPETFMRSQDGDIAFLSCKAALSYWLKLWLDHGNQARATGLSADGLRDVDALIQSLVAEGVLYVEAPAEGLYDTAPVGVLPLGSMGYLSAISRLHPDCVVCASGYSTITSNEIVHPFQRVRDPIGLRVCEGHVQSLPYRSRSTFLAWADGRAEIGSVGLEDMTLTLPKALFRYKCRQSDIKIFRNEEGRATSPVWEDQVDFVAIGSDIVAIKPGGGCDIPLAGAVISVPRAHLVDEFEDISRAAPMLDISFTGHANVVTALQCGPMLVDNGAKLDVDAQLNREGFIPSTAKGCVLPSTLHLSAGETKAARTCVGIAEDGSVFGIVIPGHATSAALDGSVPIQGATFDELAKICVTSGAMQAMALDSGGSVGLFQGGTPFFDCGDYRRGAVTRSERPLAHAVLFT